MATRPGSGFSADVTVFFSSTVGLVLLPFRPVETAKKSGRLITSSNLPKRSGARSWLRFDPSRAI